jgi:hypothetical protein
MRPQENNQKNFIVAMLLMLGVLMAWQYFYAKPALDEAQRQAEIQQQQQQGQAPAAQPSQGTSGQTTSQLPSTGRHLAGARRSRRSWCLRCTCRAKQRSNSRRGSIDTPTVSGSINLKGARLDDLRLKDYHETVDRTSPTIVLLSPANTENTYFAEQGWLSPAGANYKLPNADTVWSAPGGATLSPGNPVALNWNNGEGLTFTRTFSIDENYMISVQQSVANATGNLRADDRLGLVLLHHQADVLADRLDLYKLFGNFGVAILAVTVRQALFFPLPTSPTSRWQHEEGSAEAGRAQGQARRRPHGAAAGHDGALQEREDQPGGRLLAGADPDPGVLRALQGDLRHHRNASRAVLRLDPGPVGAGSDLAVQPVRPAALRRAAFLMIGVLAGSGR